MLKVLIAEDNPVNRELLRELLEMQGFEVFEACDGLEALARVAEVRPDLLVLDIGMTGLDGLGVIQRIRANPDFARLPVLAATAYAMRGDRENILDAGFDGYISKPINPSALKEAISQLIGSSKKSSTPNPEKVSGANV
jgi:CheY-like chemotaxis protein